ncbi:MAG: hypothetical protein ABF662_06830 [Liquorilactobacillus satsumensis]|uniref:hypothetical protein n=1 Tax=Liquorilactobacillus satsumensis TaxID=259059 RepID=UPI0039ECC48B
MNDKELSVWTYLNEVDYCLQRGEGFDVERALNFLQIAEEILSGTRKGDFEEDFLHHD